MHVVAVALFAALTLLVAACGSGSSPFAQVQHAVKTTSGDTSKFHMTITEKASGVGPFTFIADGATDASTHSAKMGLDLSPIAMLVNNGKVGHLSDWQAQVILDGRDPKNIVEYLNLPALTKASPKNKPWAKIALSDLGKVDNVNVVTLLQSAGQQDPSQALQLLQSAGNVQKTGTEKVDGVDTTHYTGSIDPSRIGSGVGDPTLGAVLAASGAKTIPVEVWIDGDHHVRKFAESVTGTSATIKIDTRLSDFGTAVDITPPPADQTMTLSKPANK